MTFKPPVIGGYSPWGKIDLVIEHVPGIWTVSTPGHGGVRLSPYRNKQIHWVWRSYGGWYEEDCAWCIPYLTFPEHLLKGDDKLTGAALDAAMSECPLEAHLALGQHLDGRDCQRRDLPPGTLVKWTAKINEAHLPDGDSSRTYSCFDDRDEEQFVQTRFQPGWPVCVVGQVFGEPIWSKRHKQLCYRVAHSKGSSLVSRSYLDPV